MLRRFSVTFAVLSLLVDGLLVAAALTLAERWRPDLLWLPWSRDVGRSELVPLELRIAVPLLWVLVLFFFSLYDPRAHLQVRTELRALLLGSAFAGLASAGMLYLSFRDVSRWLFMLFVGMAFLSLFCWRIVSRVLLSTTGLARATQRRVLIVGTGDVGQHVGQLVKKHRRAGLILVGYLGDIQEAVGSQDTIGSIQDLRAIAQSERVDDVIVTPPHDVEHLKDVVGCLVDLPLHVRVVPSSFAFALDRPHIDGFAGMPMVDLRAGPLSDYQRLVKRLLDLAVGVPLTLVALPLMAVVALVVKLDSPGSALFGQERIGEDGRRFVMYKFRTMVQNAELLQAQINVRDEAGRLIHKRPDDPRVTRIGRVLRRSSLDELPQLLNILKGEMSLVGPRPELPWLAERYEPWQRRRLVVPPGLTGWWQVNGRSDKPMHLYTDVDLYYTAHYSFWLDLWILWKTVRVVLLGKGAH